MVGMQTRVDEQSPRVWPDEVGQMHPRSEERARTETVDEQETHTPILSVDPDTLPDAEHLHHHPSGKVAAALMLRSHGKTCSPGEAETSAKPWRAQRYWAN